MVTCHANPRQLPLSIASVAVVQNTADARLRHSGTDLLACAYLMGVKALTTATEFCTMACLWPLIAYRNRPIVPYHG